MKKYRLLAYALIIVLIFSNIACNLNENQRQEHQDVDKKIIEEIEDKYFISNYSSEYNVLVTDEQDKNYKMAIEELNNILFQASKVRLNIIKSPVGKYISLGKTSDFIAKGLKADFSELGDQGYIIKTIDNNIYISGAETLGTLYGVYEFLGLTVNFDTYGPDCSETDDCKDVPLYNFDIVDKPDIRYMINAYGMFGNQGSDITIYGKRMRINDNPMMSAFGSWNHTATLYLQNDFNDHPSWLGTCLNQLCYTARGNEDEFEAMTDRVAEIMEGFLTSNKKSTYIPFMQMDYNTWCDCDACTRCINKHGGYTTSTQIIFINKVAEKLQKWIDQNQPGREATIVFFAYNNTTAAPAEKDSKGIYKPISDDMILHDNVGVFYAPIGANYYYSIYDDNNEVYREAFRGWSSLTKNILAWLYSTNFRHYLMFFDNFGGMQDTYQNLYKDNTVYLFENAQYDSTQSTGFHTLKAYLNAKLRWNTKADYNALIKKWFKGYFGSAGNTMYDLFVSIRDNVALTAYPEYKIGDVYYNLENSSFWPYAELKKWEEDIEKAYTDIGNIKGTSKYNDIALRIKRESIFIRYAIINLYPTSYNTTQLLNAKSSFKYDILSTSIDRFSEGVKLTSLFDSWGI